MRQDTMHDIHESAKKVHHNYTDMKQGTYTDSNAGDYNIQ